MIRSVIVLILVTISIFSFPSGADAASSTSGKIIFESDRWGSPVILVVDTDGKNPRRITDLNNPLEAKPEWSPNGKQILFTTTIGSHREIMLLDADANPWTPVTKLTRNGSVHNTSPAWSPNGKKIAFVSGREIYVMDNDGKNVTQLTYNAVNVFDKDPDWSPNGNEIVFVSSRNDQNNTNGSNIYVMDADGKNERQLTHNNDNTVINGDPAWSPNGNEIAFTSDADNPGGNLEIYVMDTDGNILRQLTDNDDLDSAPAWSPNGKQIVFNSGRAGIGNAELNIYLMDADGANVQQLTWFGSYSRNPAWSNGRQHKAR